MTKIFYDIDILLGKLEKINSEERKRYRGQA